MDANVRRFRRAAVPLLVLALSIGLAIPSAVAAARSDKVIVLPGATSAEGIAAGAGSTFYAGDFLGGDVFRGDVRRGKAERFIDAPEGRMAVGMKADVRHGLLFVAGGFSGEGYVYSTRTRATVAAYQFTAPGTGIVNDVAITRGGVWFTDSLQAKLYFVPVSRKGALGSSRTLALTGPAADTSGGFNLNGIEALPSGRTLIVAHSVHGKLYTVNATTGTSALIAGVEVPNVDGIVLKGRHLWAVQHASYQVTRFRMSADLRRGGPDKVIKSPAFGFPTTAALFSDRLAVVNAHLDTGSGPYEVVVVRA